MQFLERFDQEQGFLVRYAAEDGKCCLHVSSADRLDGNP